MDDAKLRQIADTIFTGNCEDDSEIIAFGRAVLAAVEADAQPVAWEQVDIMSGDRLLRRSKPTKFNAEWWRFEPLYSRPQPANVGVLVEALERLASDGVVTAQKALAAYQSAQPAVTTGAIAAAVEAEREACAQIVEAPHWKTVARNALRERAAEIRARSNAEITGG